MYYYIVYNYADLTSAIVNTMKTAPCYYSKPSKENGLVVFYIKGKK